MTLEQQLLRAAERADFAALECTPQAVGVRWKYLRGIHEAEAADLRQRAAWVRELMAKVGTGSAGLGGCDSWTFRQLTGPIPAAGTATTERKET